MIRSTNEYEASPPRGYGLPSDDSDKDDGGELYDEEQDERREYEDPDIISEEEEEDKEEDEEANKANEEEEDGPYSDNNQEMREGRSEGFRVPISKALDLSNCFVIHGIISCLSVVCVKVGGPMIAFNSGYS